MNPTSRTPALALGSVAALAWGLTGTFIKLLPTFTTIEVLSTRIFISLAVTLVIFIVRPSLWSESLALIRQPVGILLASLMVFYYLFAVRAFQLAPVSDVALVVGLSPIIGLAVKGVSRKGVALLEGVGASIAFVGLIFFVSPKIRGMEGDRTAYFIGLFFALLAACVSLGYAALFKYYSSRKASLNPIVVSCTTFAIGSVVMIPTVIVSSPEFIAKLSQPEPLKIAISLGIISTVVPTFCYSYAAKYLPPVLTTTLNLLVPVFAAAIAFLLLKETIPIVSIFGALLVFAGIIALSAAQPKASA